MAEVIWKDRKSPFLGLPLSFTRYELTEQKVSVRVFMVDAEDDGADRDEDDDLA